MSIQTVGSMDNILRSYSSDDWVKSTSLDIKKPLDLAKGIEDPFKGHEVHRSFSDMLAKSVVDVNGLQNEANAAIQQLATGKSKNIHETMLAVERADIAFRTMNQIRSKVIDAYREIMRMQI